MSKVTEEQILDTLQSVDVPGKGQSVVSLGLISGIAVKDGLVHVSIETTPENAKEMENVRQACEQVIRDVDGVQNATAVLTAEKASAQPAPQTLLPSRSRAKTSQAWQQLLPSPPEKVASASQRQRSI